MYVFVFFCVYMCLCEWLYVVILTSGTEEDYTALQQLLEDISVYVKDFATAKYVQKGLSKKKDEEDKKKEEEVRKAVIEGVAFTLCVLFEREKTFKYLTININSGSG